MLGMLLMSPKFGAFVLASSVLAITPGPGVMYIVSRTVALGRRAGFASVGGIALGSLANAAVASVGLATVLAKSRTAFFLVKLVGAAYLIALGIKALRATPTARAAESPSPLPQRRLFRDGFIVALFNPKTALFFAALLPQFLNPGVAPLGQSLVLSCIFVSIAMCSDTLYVLVAAALAPKMGRRAFAGPIGRYISACTFLGLGVYAALASPRSTR